MFNQPRFHFHNVCFMGDNGKMRSGIAQLDTRHISRETLARVRASLEFDENAVLVSHSYLGHMSQAEYESTDAIRPAQWPQVALLVGFMAIIVAVILCF